MLWMKSWLEIRWRLAFALAMVLAPLGGRYFSGVSAAESAGKMMVLVALLWLFGAVFLAGAGIRTQSPLQGTKGLHGSTQFTLSLPVSRFHLLSVRAGMGLLALFGMILISSAAAWVLFPVIRTHSTATDFVRWIFTVSCCAAGFHSVSILASTCLDEYWHVWGTVVMIGSLKWLTFRFPLPPALDVFRVMAEASPLLTHSVPWPAISVSLAFAMCVLWMAVKVAESREY
jgi:hypothetical protein